jgi:galactose-1-phosphate uridylyltransferase
MDTDLQDYKQIWSQFLLSNEVLKKNKTQKVYDKLFNCTFPHSSGIHQAPTNNKDNKH